MNILVRNNWPYMSNYKYIRAKELNGLFKMNTCYWILTIYFQNYILVSLIFCNISVHTSFHYKHFINTIFLNRCSITFCDGLRLYSPRWTKAIAEITSSQFWKPENWKVVAEDVTWKFKYVNFYFWKTEKVFIVNVFWLKYCRILAESCYWIKC